MDSSYRPAPHALDHLKQVNFVAVVGPTAAGKTTVIREAMKREPSLHLVLNNTSRPKRPDEQEGVDYRFETRKAMESRIARGEYAQVAPSVFGDLYATAAEDYSAEGVALLPVLAEAVPVFRTLPFKSMRSVFILPPDWATWQQRLQVRHFTPGKLAKRMAEAKRSLEFALSDPQTLYVISRGIERSTDDFLVLALGQPLHTNLLQDQVNAPGIVRTLLADLEKIV